MKEDDFHRWVCEDVLVPRLNSVPVVTLSTILYPLPLLARNPNYASHPLLARVGVIDAVGGLAGQGSAGGGQAKVEVLETLLTRLVLRPTEELRDRARELKATVREKAEAWGKSRGMDRPPRVVGLHVRTYYIKAMSRAAVSARDDISYNNP